MAWSKGVTISQTLCASEYTVMDSPGRWCPPLLSAAAEPHWREIRPHGTYSSNMFTAACTVKIHIRIRKAIFYNRLCVEECHDSPDTATAPMPDFWDDNPFKLNCVGIYPTKSSSGHWDEHRRNCGGKANEDSNNSNCLHETAIAIVRRLHPVLDVNRINTVRPERDQKYIDANWRPALQTPPFLSYTCGHSTGSAAGQKHWPVFRRHLLYRYYGTWFGIKTGLQSFREPLMKILGRFYGGIHFHHSCLSLQNGNKGGDL